MSHPVNMCLFSPDRIILFPNHITDLIKQFDIRKLLSVFLDSNITLIIGQHIELNSLRSRPPRLSESNGGQAQLECWNNGTLE